MATEIKAGTVLNFAYTGAVQSIVLPPGRYRLEVWGAQGGYRSSASRGGKGGYSKGEFKSEKKKVTAYVMVGGSGNTGKTAGGFNGGGKRGSYNGGGGATDIRLGVNDLLHRVIVAGGGGSDGASDKAGGYGGGTTGQSRTDNYGTGGYGGTQTGLSSSSWQADAQSTSTTTEAGAKGGFGFGGNGVTRNSGYGGAGGGGWFGGSGAYPDSSGDDDRGGAGGSGWVWTGANAPTGFGLTAADQLANASTVAGNTSFTAPGGSSETGHTGNGYARITCLELYKTVPDTPANFRQTAQDYFSIGLAWDKTADATGYKLYRDGTLVATLSASTTTYADKDLSCDSAYHYSLVAYNAEGNSDPALLTGKTTEGYAVMDLRITSVTLTPNPVAAGKTVNITVKVVEELRILEPTYPYSGEVYAGEW